MEGREGMTAGVVVTAAETKVENSSHGGGGGGGGGVAVGVATPVPTASPSPQAVAVPEAAAPATTVPVAFPPAAPSLLVAPVVSPTGGSASPTVTVDGVKKKRGRPRKYAPDGSVVMPLNATPISASMPAGEYPAASAAAAVVAAKALKRSRGRPGGLISNQHQPRFQLEGLGEMVSYSAGANFTPHIITIAAGEDVTMKIISFAQQGPRAICILSANGIISNVTLRQPDSSGGTLTYEGRFELLSLSGSFMPNETGGTRSRSGGMSVSLASPDGRVVGGGVAGLLVAASPVQVVVGSFLPSYQLDQKTNKKPRYENTSISMPAAAIPMLPSTEMGAAYGGNGQGPQNSTPKPSLVTSSSFRSDNWSPHTAPDTRNSNTDIIISLHGG
ncbi:putative AT-hook motif nuclear-localized protein 1 [Iris pallida]|uniref:AT-hook motif nuclear-localized protein n=1 Tax=Iris pallida TaxID=29817 RepID=A0AAX6ETU3_IRIPA|nr:putative AT-hook motif nuclear-localized protein 1 [Iris pallida]